MARIKYVAMILVLSALFTGCNGNINFFDSNLFQDLGVTTPTVTAPPTTAEPTVAAQAATLATLNADLASPAYLAQLTAPGNATTLKAVETYLASVYNQQVTTETTPVVQEAAVLYANLNLDTSGGTTVVQNIVTTLMNDGLNLTTDADVSTLITSILPATVTDATSFAALITGMVNANDAYTAFAATVTNPATATVADTVNMGDVAQKALVSYVVANVVDLWLPAGMTTATATPAQVAEAASNLYIFLHDSANPAAQPIGSVSTVLDTTTTGFTGITNLFTVAGLDLATYIPASN